MSDKKYVVPEDGLKASVAAAWKHIGFSSPQASPRIQAEIEDSWRVGLEAFIRWQAENPIVPTEEQAKEMLKLLNHRPEEPITANDISLCQRLAGQWQRHMYETPEQNHKDGTVEWDRDTNFPIGIWYKDHLYSSNIPNPEPKVPEENKGLSIVELINSRITEYSGWCWENLSRASAGKEPLPRLEWDKPQRSLRTYVDAKYFHQDKKILRNGEPCGHPGCLKHVSHPCEGCGRIGGMGEGKNRNG